MIHIYCNRPKFSSRFFLRLMHFAMIISLAACTSNPFDHDDEIGDGQRRMTGKVSIFDGASPERVFVWMKGMNLSTYTDANGEYSFRLSDGVADRSGVVQRDTLYFYLANYQIARRYVDIIEGTFKYSSADLDEDGVARETIMRRTIIINSIVSFMPNRLDETASNAIRVLVKLSAEEGCAPVFNPFVGALTVQREAGDSTAYPLGAVLIRNLDSDAVFTVRSQETDDGADRMAPCSWDTYYLKLDFTADEVGLPPGRYEVAPYLWLEPENAPDALLDVIGRENNELNANYFKKPMKRLGGSFELQ